jgi:arylsulfatase A-like enzyme
MPQLDALAKQGVVFRNAVSGHPVCAAFRASLFTGKYTYAIYRQDRKELLFDNLKDPYQLRNLADNPEQAQTLDHFRSLLKARLKELGDTFEAST